MNTEKGGVYKLIPTFQIYERGHFLTSFIVLLLHFVEIFFPIFDCAIVVITKTRNSDEI